MSHVRPRVLKPFLCVSIVSSIVILASLRYVRRGSIQLSSRRSFDAASDSDDFYNLCQARAPSKKFGVNSTHDCGGGRPQRRNSNRRSKRFYVQGTFTMTYYGLAGFRTFWIMRCSCASPHSLRDSPKLFCRSRNRSVCGVLTQP